MDHVMTPTPARPPTEPDPPPWHRRTRATHVVSVMAGLVGALVVLAFSLAGWSGADRDAVYPVASVVASWALVPAAIVAVLSGLPLAVRAARRPGVTTALRLKLTGKLTIAGAFAAVTVLLSIALNDAAHGGNLDRSRHPGMAAVATVLVGANVALAQYKPGPAPARPRRRS